MLVSHPAAFASSQRGLPPFAAGATPVYLFLGLTLALMPVALAATGLHVVAFEFGVAGGMFAFSLWFAWCLRGRGLQRIAIALEGCTLFYATCMTVLLATFIAGTGHRAFFDASLAKADRVLLPGFDWPRAMLSFSRSGLPARIANRAYESIGWQPPLLIATLSMTSKHDRVWHFLLSWIATLCITVAVFAYYPVLGAYRHFGIAAADVPAMLDSTPWNQPVLLEGLRDGTLSRISLATLDGIVNYPSFHAGAAVLLAYGFWSVRPLRWPLITLNTLMLASAVPIGGHYLVDLFAGAIAAGAGIAAAELVTSRQTTACVVGKQAPQHLPSGALI
jgi:membrane-associated phospholipid phosphatase